MSTPSTREGILLDASVVDALSTWLSGAGRGDVAVLTSARPGCGITTMIDILAVETGCEAMWVTPMPGVRLREQLRDVSMTDRTALENKKKIIVLDPVDALLADQIVGGDVLEYLKTRGPKSVPIICAGFLQRAPLAKILDAVSKRSVLFHFPRIPDAIAVHALRASFDDVPEKRLADAWADADGDFRSCMASLAMGEKCGKDIVCDGTEAISAVLFDPEMTIERAMRLHDGDAHLLGMGIFENYHLAAGNIAACGEIAEAFSMAVIVEECMYGRQQWDLGEFYAALTTGVANAWKSKTAARKPIEKVGTVWSRSNNQRSKEKSVRGITAAAIEAGRSPLPPQDLALVRGLMTRCSKDNRYDRCMHCLEPYDDATVLAIMRLFKSGYTQTDHSKFKKARLAAK